MGAKHQVNVQACREKLKFNISSPSGAGGSGVLHPGSSQKEPNQEQVTRPDSTWF